jgi:hypothetical protein
MAGDKEKKIIRTTSSSVDLVDVGVWADANGMSLDDARIIIAKNKVKISRMGSQRMVDAKAMELAVLDFHNSQSNKRETRIEKSLARAALRKDLQYLGACSLNLQGTTVDKLDTPEVREIVAAALEKIDKETQAYKDSHDNGGVNGNANGGTGGNGNANGGMGGNGKGGPK